MKTMYHICAVFVAMVMTAGAKKTCAPFPPTMDIFTSGFEEPNPPMVKPQFNTSFLQHKWNANLSHITSGYIYNLPQQKQVIVDEAYEGSLAASTFNYGNISTDGLVDNTLIEFPIDGNNTNLEMYRGYVNPGFPLITDDFLVSNGATYGGLTTRDLVPGQVAMWNIMYQGAIPVKVYVDTCNMIVGYDFFSTNERTYVITMYFNTQTA